jgi:hypothetical protein
MPHPTSNKRRHVAGIYGSISDRGTEKYALALLL